MAACDVASPGELAALTERLQAAGAPPISGVVHAGGIIQVHICANDWKLMFVC
jgi:KR domain